MNQRIWLGLMVLGALAAGCSQAGGPAATSDRRRDVAKLLEEALRARQDDSRTALLLAAADRASDDIVRVAKSIQASREIVVQNIRNADTVAYKALYPVRQADGSMRTAVDTMQGSMDNTGRNLDVAIEGEGFFCVADAEGTERYTRNGNLFVNRHGVLVLGLGDAYQLRPKIVVPAATTDLSITKDGKVDAIVNSRKTAIGQLRLFRPPLPGQLAADGPGLYVTSPPGEKWIMGSPGENGLGQLLQGFLEGSNVDLTRERLRLRFLSDWSDALYDALDHPMRRPTARP